MSGDGGRRVVLRGRDWVVVDKAPQMTTSTYFRRQLDPDNGRFGDTLALA